MFYEYNAKWQWKLFSSLINFLFNSVVLPVVCSCLCETTVALYNQHIRVVICNIVCKCHCKYNSIYQLIKGIESSELSHRSYLLIITTRNRNQSERSQALSNKNVYGRELQFSKNLIKLFPPPPPLTTRRNKEHLTHAILHSKHLDTFTQVTDGQ